MYSESDGTSTESVCSSISTIDTSLDVTDGSVLSDNPSRTSLWPVVDTSTISEIDFGSLSEGYGPPLLICFYNDPCGNNVSRIGG
ncbi:hypothetical protein GCK32_010422 [Trichostrongylus colubriformis]|uniref:Uncharacterized protein n=1 Tax=Trichostrongylus colubriformis TaxID=6319 RepID=A0AAN8F3R0_TRICO